MNYAAANGHLDIVKWLHENGTEGCTTDAMNQAAANGHLEVVKWLHENRKEGCTVVAMDYASANGHFEVVKWLFENNVVKCRQRALDSAAKHGRYEIVKFLIQHGMSATSKTLETASKGGHLDVVKYLIEDAAIQCTAKAISKAASNAEIKVFDYLSQKFPNLVNKDIIYELAYACAETGDVWTFERCESVLNKYSTTSMLDIAAERGHLEVVKWLHDVAEVPFSDRTAEVASVNGFLKVVNYLCTAGANIKHSSIQKAIRYGYLDVLKCLTKLKPEFCSRSTLEYAIEWGDPTIIKYCVDELKIDGHV